MRISRFIIALVLTTALGAASPLAAQTTPDRPMAMAPAIIGSTWTAVEINGAPAPTQLSTFRVAEDNVTASGKGGCNSWSAPVSIDGGSIGIGTIRATNMACLGPGMKQEREYFAALGVTRSLEVADGELRFLDASGTIVIRFAV